MPAQTTASPTAADKAADKAVDAMNGAADRAESALAEAARKAETVIRDSVETLRAQTRAYADTAAEKFDDTQRVVTDHVREKPIQSILAAAGLGLVIGLLLGRRH